MPRRILPHLETLLTQISGIVRRYCRMLDDDLMFGAGVQVPQVATILDRVGEQRLTFSGEDLLLTELLTLIAYRYGLESVQVIGHGGYAIVLSGTTAQQQRRVMRLVPEHHVRRITCEGGQRCREFDVCLDDNLEPIRDERYPLLLSDLFLLPRHTTTLVFRNEAGEVLQAGGYPARLHCQLLPEVRALDHRDLNPRMARHAGDLLEAALATLGVGVADAHGGNGGVLLGEGGEPILHGGAQYVPVVLDYGYYSAVGARALARVLLHHGVTRGMVERCLAAHNVTMNCEEWPGCLPGIIAESGVVRSAFGRLLFEVEPPFLDPMVWVNRAEHRWQTVKERTYPPLQDQARLSRMYPDYDEVLFPQRVEEYNFRLEGHTGYPSNG